MKVPEKKFAPFTTQRLDKRGKPIETVVIDLAADLRIGHDLQKALRTSMTTFGWYMQLKEQAHAKMKWARHRAHTVAEEKYVEIKDANPRLSETQAKNRVHLDPSWLKRIRSYMRWRDRYRMLHGICEALKDRNENLRTLEASERKEREGKY